MALLQGAGWHCCGAQMLSARSALMLLVGNVPAQSPRRERRRSHRGVRDAPTAPTAPTAPGPPTHPPARVGGDQGPAPRAPPPGLRPEPPRGLPPLTSARPTRYGASLRLGTPPRPRGRLRPQHRQDRSPALALGGAPPQPLPTRLGGQGGFAPAPAGAPPPAPRGAPVRRPARWKPPGLDPRSSTGGSASAFARSPELSGVQGTKSPRGDRGEAPHPQRVGWAGGQWLGQRPAEVRAEARVRRCRGGAPPVGAGGASGRAPFLTGSGGGRCARTSGAGGRRPPDPRWGATRPLARPSGP